MTLCPSGEGDGLEIHWALPAGVRIPSVSHSKVILNSFSFAQCLPGFALARAACAESRREVVSGSGDRGLRQSNASSARAGLGTHVVLLSFYPAKRLERLLLRLRCLFCSAHALSSVILFHSLSHFWPQLARMLRLRMRRSNLLGEDHARPQRNRWMPLAKTPYLGFPSGIIR